jgi:hypothetical protein
VNDYLKMTNRKKVTIRDIDPKSISTQELYGFVNMATREWKVGGVAGLAQDACSHVCRVSYACPPMCCSACG